MKLETLLPLGKVDDDPLVVMALTAQATRTLQLGTGVAIAFSRTPAITAMSAWSLQKQQARAQLMSTAD